MRIRQHLQRAGQKLAHIDGPARLEAEILLAHVLETNRSFFYAHSEIEVPAQRGAEYRELVEKRVKGMPIAYLTGRREFWSLPLRVTPDVLIPRPETELLVEAALERIPESPGTRVADLGTGSGAIALAIASERREARIEASDISELALDVARGNALDLGLPNVQFLRGSWCEPLDGKFAVIVSNPPYVAGNDPHLVEGDCRHEPRLALTSGGDGLASIREIAGQAGQYLEPGGWLLLEHGHDQGSAVRALLRVNGFEASETRRDLQGHDRVTLGRMPDTPA